jgi:hypothetical protein
MKRIIQTQDLSVNTLTTNFFQSYDLHSQTREAQGCSRASKPNPNMEVLPMQITLPSRLPKLQFKILNLFYDDYVIFGHAQSDRSVKNLADRFKRCEDKISHALSCLTKLGLLDRIKGGSRSWLRWITYVGISYLDIKRTDQTADQIGISPYIDLSKREDIDIKILEEQQPCGQIIIEPFEQAILQLENVFVEQQIPASHRTHIKNELRTSSIGPERAQEMIGRIVKLYAKKHPIHNLRSFIDTSIQNEEKQIADLKVILGNKPVNVNMYADFRV